MSYGTCPIGHIPQNSPRGSLLPRARARGGPRGCRRSIASRRCAAGAGADAVEVVAGDVLAELGVGLDRALGEDQELGAEAGHLLAEAGLGGGLGLAADLVEQIGADALDYRVGVRRSSGTSESWVSGRRVSTRV